MSILSFIMNKTLFLLFFVIIIGSCSMEKKSISGLQREYTFNITKPEILIGTRPGNLIEFEGYLYSIDGVARYVDLDWISDVDGVFAETRTNNDGKVQFYCDNLSENIHQISIVLSDPEIEQSDTLNYVTVYNNIPESVDLYTYRFIGQYNDNFYFIGDSELIWDSADSLAQESNMHLVTITSEDENTFIKYALPFDEDYYEYSNYWIGLFFNPVNNMVEWVTGEPVVYTGYSDQSLMPDAEKRFGYVYKYYRHYNDFYWRVEASADSSSSWHSCKNHIAEYEGNY